MKVLLTRLTAFVGRHWLRVGLIGCAVILISQKEVAVDLRFGLPAGVPLPTATPAAPQESGEPTAPLLLSADRPSLAGAATGFFSRLNIFGGSSAPAVSLRADRLAQRQIEVAAFVDRFGEVARAEQQKFGIPASIVLATGLLYSEAGTRASARHGNSYFALPCGTGWSGATMEDGNRCVRGYPSAWLAMRDFSTTVTSGNFSRIRQFAATDYRRWAAGLQELGLNGDERYAADVTALIERYGLDRFDRA